MDPSRVSRILKDWSAVASEARRPPVPPRPVVRTGLSGGILAGATIVALLLVAFALLGRQGPNDVVGNAPPAPPSSTATPVATPSPDTTPTPVPTQVAVVTPRPTASPAPTASSVPTIGSCAPAKLSARITSWEGAAGHRVANMELTNTGSSRCTVMAMARPQLVDGQGSVLIDGTNPPGSGVLTVSPGHVLKTLVQDSNYCGPAPTAPVSVAFVFSGGGRIIATPATPTDTTLPPCLGAGSAGDIEMQPWSP